MRLWLALFIPEEGSILGPDMKGREWEEKAWSRSVGSDTNLANLKEAFGAEVRWGKVVYLCHTCDSNSYPLRCLYILTLGLQGHNLKGYPVENAKKGKQTKNVGYELREECQAAWKQEEGGVKGRSEGKQHKMKLQGPNTKTQTLGANQLFRQWAVMELCRFNFPEPLIIIPRSTCLSFTNPQYPREPVCDLFILHYRPNSQNVLMWAISYMSHERCVAKHQTKIVRDDWLSFPAEEDQHKSVEESMRACVYVWNQATALPNPSAWNRFHFLIWMACFILCDYLSDPCHIQGDTLRSFDILTATEDGHYLQRESMWGHGRGREGGREEREAGQHNIISVNMWKEGTEVRV